MKIFIVLLFIMTNLSNGYADSAAKTSIVDTLTLGNTFSNPKTDSLMRRSMYFESDDDVVEAPYEGETCEEQLHDDPPFYVSDEYKQGDKIWENLRDIDNHAKSHQFIPKGSIVHSPPELSEVSYHPDSKIPVEVLSVPPVEFEDELKGKPGERLRRFRNTALTPDGLPRAEKGSTGFLMRNALEPAGKYTFFVKKDMKLEGLPENFSLADKRLSLKMKGDKYEGQYCCIDRDVESEAENTCFFKYTFEVLNTSGQVEEEVNVDVLSCNFAEQIMPVPYRDGIAEDMQRVLKLMIDGHPGFGALEGIQNDDVDFSGFRVLPEARSDQNDRITREYMVRMPVDHETGKGPFNSFHYNPDDHYSSDAFLQPIAMCGFMSALKKFNESCGNDPGCQVQWGNAFHKPSWKTHSSHGTGHCIDIRPMRKNDDADQALTYSRSRHSRYSQERTQLLVDILYEAGASYIGFQDSKITLPKGKIRRATPRMSRPANHKDHIHVCFDPKEDSQVNEVCAKGLKSPLAPLTSPVPIPRPRPDMRN